RHHVLDTQALEHGTHRTTGDDTGTLRSRAQEHLTGTPAAIHVMMQRAAFAQRHAHHRLLRSSGRLRDGFRHFASLAMAEADTALAIADNDESCKAEALTALYGVGNAVDVDQLFNQLVAFTALATLFFRFARHS